MVMVAFRFLNIHKVSNLNINSGYLLLVKTFLFGYFLK